MQTQNTTPETYNGWTNYATWRVNLEIVDDYVASLIGEGIEWYDVTTCAEALAEYVSEIVTGDCDTSSNLAASYAEAFLSQVNYREIAEIIHTDNPELFAS